MKQQALVITAILTSTITVTIQSAIAGQIPPTPVRCYFFEGETLALKSSCVYKGSSWAGGGGSTLTWKDGVVTGIQYGLQGRGERICSQEDQIAVDGVCGRRYARSLNTLKRISNNREPAMTCVQLENESVCWKF